MNFWLIILLLYLLFATVKSKNESDKWRDCILAVAVITNITIGLIFK